ncbi:hypothetical protein MAPG_00278 [Magnaporthiopsis poae ATCC 64411]|uniref:C2H2-type domain-containing protein n=1 Tax=Magnaporthiopsis poae (strain ATCC 64411 / 73-15) TaxID=644358 RepID=A0A0C4DKK3_MAGP6|nr:hypothetical protein MAPG_00278 [Magnaporthiopsis poae ATCC 64411]
MSHPSRHRRGASHDVQQQSVEWADENDTGGYYQGYQEQYFHYAYAQGQTPAYGGDTGFSGTTTAPSTWPMDPFTAMSMDHAQQQQQQHDPPLLYSAAPAQDIYGATAAAHEAYGHTQHFTPATDPAALSSGVHDSATSASMADPVYEGKFDEEPLPSFESHKNEDGLYDCGDPDCESGSYDTLRDFKAETSRKHMRTHLKPVICPLSPLCNGWRTAEQRDMIRHVRAHHPAWAARQPNLPQGGFPCDLCKQVFTRKDNLRKHEKDIHGIQA